MKSFFVVASLVSALVTTGCSSIDTTLVKATQGATGCPAASVIIVDRDLGMNTTWTAKCGDKTYFCSFGEPSQCKEAQVVSK